MNCKTQILHKLDKFWRLLMALIIMRSLLSVCSCQTITRIVMNTSNQEHFIVKIGFLSIFPKMKKRSSALNLRYLEKNLNLQPNVSKQIKINQQRLQLPNIHSVDLFRVQLVSLRQRTKIFMDMKCSIKQYHSGHRSTSKISKRSMHSLHMQLLCSIREFL